MMRSNFVSAGPRPLCHEQAKVQTFSHKPSLSKRHLGKTSDKVVNQKLRLIDLSTGKEDGRQRVDCPHPKAKGGVRMKKDPHHSS